jgi:hypothetical protein
MEIAARYDWTLPSDWREIASIFDLAVGYAMDFFESSKTAEFTIYELSEITHAMDYIIQVPPNLRPQSFNKIDGFVREIYRVKFHKVRSALGLAFNPLETVLSLGVGLLTKVELDALDLATPFLKEWQEKIVLQQIKLCQQAKIPPGRDSLFDQQLGRLIYWYGFQERPLIDCPPNLELTPDLANGAMKRHRFNLDETYSSSAKRFDIWYVSDFCKDDEEAHRKMKRYLRKMDRGGDIAKVERAWSQYVQVIDTRHQYIHWYAERMNWAKN